MKKSTSLVFVLSMLFLPMTTFAGPSSEVKISNMAQYSWNTIDEDTYHVNFGAFACKTQTCNVNNPADWFNFSSTSGNDSTGEGSTLIVSPGDTITFLVETTFTHESEGDAEFTPSLTLDFINGAALEDFATFSDEKADLDKDGKNYTIIGNTISFDTHLDSDGVTQLGTITAKIKTGTPDGTNLGLKLTFDDEQTIQEQVMNPFINRAHADEVAQSDVRIIVNNPAVQSAQVLPKTGHPSSTSSNFIAIAILTFLTSFVGLQVVGQRRKQTK